MRIKFFTIPILDTEHIEKEALGKRSESRKERLFQYPIQKTIERLKSLAKASCPTDGSDSERPRDVSA